MMSMLNEDDLNLVGRANQLLHWLKAISIVDIVEVKNSEEKEEAIILLM